MLWLLSVAGYTVHDSQRERSRETGARRFEGGF